jgi:NTE family protein
VDGGVLDNLPVGPMAAQEAGPIVAVDVMRQLPVARDGEGPLSLLEILVRATVLGGRHASALATEHVSLVISPRVQDIGLRDFRQIDRAVEAGRRAARTMLERRDDLALASPR